jgi:hypothetical protein
MDAESGNQDPLLGNPTFYETKCQIYNSFHWFGQKQLRKPTENRF